MSDNILNRFSSRLGTESIVDSAADEDVEEFPSFAILRGTRERAVCLELRKKSGDAIALPYGMIHRFEFDGATRIKLYCADGLVVTVTGRNLQTALRSGLTLFGALSRYLVIWFGEQGRSVLVGADARAVTVDSIDW